jgi:hypothetical protein
MLSSLLVLSTSGLQCSQTLENQETAAAGSLFVQAFLDWYAPLALNFRGGPAWNVALKEKRSAFAPDLIRWLSEDSEAQRAAKGIIVGLDFDPFLNTQDPCERYQVGTVNRRGNSYWVQIHSVCGGRRGPRPRVIAEISRGSDGSWAFVNFHYPDERSNLLTVLRLLREERQKHSR